VAIIILCDPPWAGFRFASTLYLGGRVFYCRLSSLFNQLTDKMKGPPLSGGGPSEFGTARQIKSFLAVQKTLYALL
jgi:hypothetical protein